MKKIKNIFFLTLKSILLQLPLLSFLIFKYFKSIELSPSQVIYIFSVAVGYYFVLLTIICVPLLVFYFFPKIAKFLIFFILTILMLYFAVDSIVYPIYKFHINYFFINLFFLDFDNFGFTYSNLLTGVIILLGILLYEFLVIKLVSKLSNKILFLVSVPVIFVIISQLIYVYSFERGITAISGLTNVFPLYYPLESKELASREPELSSLLALNKDYSELEYPKVEINIEQEDSLPNIIFIVLESVRYDMFDSVVMPNVVRFSEKSIVCKEHYSTGNATIPGIFGIFYSLHPNYWQTVKENRKEINNPVFIDVLQKLNYKIKVFSHSNLERFKLHSAIFNGITINENYAGGSPWEKDKNMTDSIIDFIENNDRFFTFIFYSSSHHSYYFPSGFGKFTPYSTIDITKIDNDTDSLPYINAYKNSVFYLDYLIGKILLELRNSGKLRNTIVVITSDHGEEFNENKFNYWGHGSNFTKYQVQVPCIIYIPGKNSREITFPTSHIDIVPTILEECLLLETPLESYSSGKNLFKLNEKIKRPFVVYSYVTYAFIMERDVWEIRPLGIRKYSLDGIRIHANPVNTELIQKAFSEISYFYKE